MKYSRVRLHTFGYVLPPVTVSSSELENQLLPIYERLKLPLGRLEMMSGIRERRFWELGTRPSQGAIWAGQRVLEQAELEPSQIDCLIFTSVSRDMMEPATAAFVHRGLKLSERCLLFDLSNACLGFLDGMLVLANMIETGQVKNGMVVAGETAEELVQSTINALLTDISLTRQGLKPAFASLTIGSGAVALYMCRQELDAEGICLSHGAWRANTECVNLCQGNTQGQRTTLMNTMSEELMHRGVETAHTVWKEFSAKSGWSEKEISCYFCHQVGSAHAKLLFSQLGLNAKKNFETLGLMGNVGSVSAPITMAMAIEQRRFIAGQKGAMLGIGSGINSLMLGVEWKEGV